MLLELNDNVGLWLLIEETSNCQNHVSVVSATCFRCVKKKRSIVWKCHWSVFQQRSPSPLLFEVSLPAGSGGSVCLVHVCLDGSRSEMSAQITPQTRILLLTCDLAGLLPSSLTALSDGLHVLTGCKKCPSPLYSSRPRWGLQIHAGIFSSTIA